MQDLDQIFGRMSSYISHHLKEAQNLDTFAACLRKFLSRIGRPHERIHFVHRVDRVRDWKGLLAHMGRHLRGIGGPNAPKVFEFSKLQRILTLPHLRSFAGLFMFFFGWNLTGYTPANIMIYTN